ncbi:beta-lactamase superfamily domain-containing protein [Dendryphion nanum]|uniref:Beta-lactamase superfamily domain-containing protein n=1 Tax=Dendryphion nanum TaxID=256645 RepID=A0A9P9E3V6_9PLEO|nr:beta-lactamase superfamily domain-containing protein [Dendryphion nanum]
MTSIWASEIKITYIGTATAILSIDGINFLTDPFFSKAGRQWPRNDGKMLENTEDPAMSLHDLPVIDAVLLSHENHPDNLDELGRQLLDGRWVFTTPDGADNLAPRPAVHGLNPWESISVQIAGKPFQITATPCIHYPGHECTGLIITTPNFGETNGLRNAIYFSGDTIYVEELAEMRHKFHIKIALFNIGAAWVATAPDVEPIQITMCGKQASRLFREIGAEILVPMHFESWKHFTEPGHELRASFEEEGVSEHVCWLEAGITQKIV